MGLSQGTALGQKKTALPKAMLGVENRGAQPMVHQYGRGQRLFSRLPQQF
jgi:hypothetical protein